MHAADQDYLSLPLRTFLTDLAARSPTPGGGSVAALIGAVASAQARMVLAYTVGKPKFAEHEAHLHELSMELERAERMFTQLMTEDMAAYQRLAAARKSDDADERQRAIATATAVPMEIAALAAAVLARLDEAKTRVNPYLFSDLQVAGVLAYAAAGCAALNVRVNLPELADRAEAERLEQDLTRFLEQAHRHRTAVVRHRAG